MPPESSEPSAATGISPSSDGSLMRKTVAISAIVVVLILAYAVVYLFAPQQSQPRLSDEQLKTLDTLSTPANAEGVPLQFDAEGIAVVVRGAISQFVDSKTGISFSYPTEWGKVEVADERGECPADIQESCNLRTYSLPDVASGSIFLATKTKGHDEYPVGRGAFWGDAAGALSAFFADECQKSTNCTLMTNAEGTVIAKRMGVYEMGGDEEIAAKKIAYSVYSDKGPYYGLVLTASRFSQPGDAQEKRFEDVLIASLKLSTH